MVFKPLLLPHGTELVTAPTTPRPTNPWLSKTYSTPLSRKLYDDKPVPRCILLSHDITSRALLAEALSTKAERKIEVRVPSRGPSRRLSITHSTTHAKP